MSRYRAARGCDTATVRHDTTLGAAIRAAQRTRARSDTAEGACDMVGAGPRYGATARHDTAQCALPGFSARGLCAQAGPRCAPGAPNPVLTQCNVLSHRSWALFKRISKKKKNYKIK